MTVAYVVLSHRNPEQVLRLVRALGEGPASRVLLRHDPAGEPLERRAAEAAGATLLDDGLRLDWGGWAQAEVVLRALRSAADLHDPDWVLVVSGQDYPLRSLAAIEAELAASGADALLGAVTEVDLAHRPGPGGDEFFLRAAYRHYRVPTWTPHLPRALRPLAYVRRAPPRLGVRRRAPAATPWFASSDWVTLGRRGLAAVLAADPALVRYHRRVAVPSESLFATVLLNDPSLTVERDHRRFTAFTPGAAHPDTLTLSDLDRVLASGAQFARKFDAGVDAGVLDALDDLRPTAI